MSHTAHDDNEMPHHVTPIKVYLGIFSALILFTLITIAVAYVHLGPMNLAIAVFIATIKAALVVTFFMHLKDDSRLNSLIFLGSLLFAGVFLAYTLNDTEYRSQVDIQQGNYVDPSTGETAPSRTAP